MNMAAMMANAMAQLQGMSAPDPTAVYVKALINHGNPSLNLNSGAAWLAGQARHRAPEFLDHNAEPRNQNVSSFEWTQFAEKVSADA